MAGPVHKMLRYHYDPRIAMRLLHTFGGTVQPIIPQKKSSISLYSCGPTVYQRAHVGNLRTYIMVDILKRALLHEKYTVHHVLNITDVGHLTEDSDDGEDKVEREARAQHKTAKQITKYYERLYKTDVRALGILKADIYPRASEHIKEQIAMVRALEQKGLTYRTSDGIYFDTAKFPTYGILAQKNLKGLQSGARVAVGEKRSPTDFALWKFSPPAGARRQMEWKSPWGVGFPGWHIECSAMSIKYLGSTIDIHTGGIDHINIHHSNEIAQSEAVTHKPFVKYWMHINFLVLPGSGEDAKMAKSKGNVVTLDDIRARKFDPLDFRYMMLLSHWQQPVTFSWDALEAASVGRKRLIEAYARAPKKLSRESLLPFWDYIADNLHTPKAIAWLWTELNAGRISQRMLRETDTLLGLGLTKRNIMNVTIPSDIAALVAQRERARAQQDWTLSDTIREQLKSLGWSIEDTSSGPIVHKL
mgnify:FL=1